ncbi:hypothetical protein PG985_004477 [Apiospora marii]|uniref:Cyanovirin-N domain-containing protein n=1 Tax=Apiospora marii TaxID=335849 RepID=A0ABR1S9E9_9PEZI
MVIKPLYEPDMAPPYPSDSASPQGRQDPEPYVSPLPRIPTNPPGGSPPARPMSSDSPSESRPAGYPYSPDQLSYPSYVRGHSYQQPAPVPVPSPYLYTGQPSPSYAAPQQYSQQYPQQPTYAEAPATQPSYPPQPPYSPQSPQPPYPSLQPSAFEAPAQPQYANPPVPQPSYSPQPPGSPQPPYPSSQPAAFEAPAQPQYASPPAPPPYSSSAFGDDYPGDVKKEYPSVDPVTGASMPPGTDEERGLMGAVLGGAAGAYAGHKANHGVLGALGGAYAGHKLEDAWKDHRNSRPSSSSSQQHQPIMAPPQPQYAEAPAPLAPAPAPSPQPEPPRFGNFSHSSARISLDRDYDLIAECRTLSGQQKLTSISLNQLLRNSDGHFQWVGSEDTGNFGATARNVRLVDDGRFLEAELRAMDGAWRWDRVHLDEKIMNIDGDLQVV